MKYHIHIPKLEDFALNVVCDDITLHGAAGLVKPIPYPLYLRCIMTYADKYDKNRYSLYRFYRDIRRNAIVDDEIGRIYPNVLDHIVLDDDDDNVRISDSLLLYVSKYSPLDDAIASIKRLASRCLVADRMHVLVDAMSSVLGLKILSQPITDLFISCGAKLSEADELGNACACGMNDVVRRYVKGDCYINDSVLRRAVESGNLETIELVHSAHRGNRELGERRTVDMLNVTVELLELMMSCNIIHQGTHYLFSNIPSISVLNWILDHDVIDHRRAISEVVDCAARYSGHYFDMLTYLIEQRNVTVPRDIWFDIVLLSKVRYFDALDYLCSHGADVSTLSAFGTNILECSPMLVRYWMDKGLTLRPNNHFTVLKCMQSGMTPRVLEMVIRHFAMDAKAVDEYGGDGSIEA